MKKCRKCGVEKPLTEFYKAKTLPDGHMARCKPCRKEYLYGWKKENKDKVKAYKAKSYDEKGRHKGATYQSLRRARLVQAASLYGELDELIFDEMRQHCKDLEALTGAKWEVDHIVPLKNKDACGLHYHANWQVVPMKWNRAKGALNMEDYS